jgi:hypothetical protein
MLPTSKLCFLLQADRIPGKVTPPAAPLHFAGATPFPKTAFSAIEMRRVSTVDFLNRRPRPMASGT